MNSLTEQRVQELADALRSDGWCCRPRFFDDALVTALRADLQQRRGQFSDAAVGRAQQRRREEAVRADKTLWLTGETAAQQSFLRIMAELCAALNRHLYLGLHDYEGHYAHYAPGAFYRRHLDVFNGGGPDAGGAAHPPRRVLSSICYLNENWLPHAGGELVLWDRNDREIAKIDPAGGTGVFFISDEFPHEVRPAKAERYSIAGWFRSAGYFPNKGGV